MVYAPAAAAARMSAGPSEVGRGSVGDGVDAGVVAVGAGFVGWIGVGAMILKEAEVLADTATPDTRMV